MTEVHSGSGVGDRGSIFDRQILLEDVTCVQEFSYTSVIDLKSRSRCSGPGSGSMPTQKAGRERASVARL